MRNRNVFADTIAVKRLNPVVFWLAVFGAVWVATWLLTKVQRAVLAAGFHFSARGRWRVVVGLGPLLEFFGGISGPLIAFEAELSARVYGGDVDGAKALIRRRLGEEDVAGRELNTAICSLISAGAYQAALRIRLPRELEQQPLDGLGLVLCHINLAEAEYNLGRWDEAEARLCGLDLACGLANITRAGLLQQRAWIAAHQGEAKKALDLCDRVEVNWLPKGFHAEYHFTRAVALIGAGRLLDAQAAARSGHLAARRLPSQRNSLFILARVAAANGDWVSAERHCRAAAEHRFRSQGGDGLVLWAESLDKLGRPLEAAAARQLVLERDPESEAAQTLAGTAAA